MKRSFSGLHPSKRQSGTEESQGRIHASSQPSSRLRDQNLGEPRYPRWVRYGSNRSRQNGGPNDDKGKDCSHLGLGDNTGKAGVGGSTPSVATKSLTFNDLPLILHP